MEPKGPQINHFSFADDVIIFTSTNRESMKFVRDTLEEYEHSSQQLINMKKSYFIVLDKTSQDIIHIIHEVT